MNEQARIRLNQYLSNLARANNRESIVGQEFNVNPKAQQSFYEAASNQADFLKNINNVDVSAQTGEKVGLTMSRPIASRTDTNEGEREPRDISDLDGNEYFCFQTNYDSYQRYTAVDSWAHVADFGAVYVSALAKKIARDRLMIGFNGEFAAKNTDVNQYPWLQDVNIGWEASVRKVQPQRILGYDSNGVSTDDTYNLGEGGDYGSLDSLVFDLVSNLLDAWHQQADDLVVLVGRDIWVSHGLSLLSKSTLPTERNALQTWFSDKTVGGYPCLMPPYIKPRSVYVTSYDNLSIYHQLGSMRRTIIDNPKRDRVEDYISNNEAFVVEDFGKFAAVRNGAILLKNPRTGEWG